MAPTLEDALAGIRRLVADVTADLMANGEPVPPAIALRHYTVKFIVRVPPEVHRRLVLEAAEEGVSLNRVVSAKLSQ